LCDRWIPACHLIFKKWRIQELVVGDDPFSLVTLLSILCQLEGPGSAVSSLCGSGRSPVDKRFLCILVTNRFRLNNLPLSKLVTVAKIVVYRWGCIPSSLLWVRQCTQTIKPLIDVVSLIFFQLLVFGIVCNV